MVEQALLIMMAAAALIAMFTYIRQAMAYRIKVGADGMGQGLLYRP